MKYMWVFMNGKQVRIKRPPTIEGMCVDEFIQRNVDPIWLHQNEMWEYIGKIQGVDQPLTRNAPRTGQYHFREIVTQRQNIKKGSHFSCTFECAKQNK